MWRDNVKLNYKSFIYKATLYTSEAKNIKYTKTTQKQITVVTS